MDELQVRCVSDCGNREGSGSFRHGGRWQGFLRKISQRQMNMPDPLLSEPNVSCSLLQCNFYSAHSSHGSAACPCHHQVWERRGMHEEPAPGFPFFSHGGEPLLGQGIRVPWLAREWTLPSGDHGGKHSCVGRHGCPPRWHLSSVGLGSSGLSRISPMSNSTSSTSTYGSTKGSCHIAISSLNILPWQ